MFRTDLQRYFIGIMISILLIMVSSATGGRTGRNDLVGNYIDKHPRFSNDQKPRTCQIYSHITQKHIQVLPKRVYANGEEGDEYALLEKTSISFGVVTIRGIKSGRYVCMSKRGKLLARKKLSHDGSCFFIENITTAFWTSFENQMHRKWYIGFSRNKKPKRGRKTKENQVACDFLIRDPETSNREIQTVPDHMKELVESLKRKLRQSHGLTRKRRHRLRTENPIGLPVDDGMVAVPSWAKSPPHKASEARKKVWVIRMKNYIKKLGPESTPSSYELEMTSPSTPTPEAKRRQRHKSRGSPRRSRSERRFRSNHRPAKLRPTSSPSRRKLMKDSAVPRTPIREKPESPVLSPTVSSPSFYKIKDDSKETIDRTEAAVSEPTIISIERDSASKRTNNIRSDSDFSEGDQVSRIQTPKVSSSRSRRKPQTNRSSRKRHHAVA